MGACQAFKQVQFLDQSIFNGFTLSANPYEGCIYHTVSITDEQSFQEWQASIHSIKNNNHIHKYLLLPLTSKYNSPGLLCNAGGNAELTYQKHKQTLDAMLVKNRKNKTRLKQTEIWYILFVIAKVGKHFEKLGKNFGSYAPKSILYNDQTQIRLISRLSYPFNGENLPNPEHEKGQQLYIVPEQISSRQNIRDLLSSSEVFQAGLTILQCGVTENLEKLHLESNSKKTDVMDKIECLIGKMEGKYSPMLSNYIRQMLNANPNKRVKMSQISKQLQKYEQKILKRAFSGDNSASLATLKLSKACSIDNYTRIFETSLLSEDKQIQLNSQNRYTKPYDIQDNLIPMNSTI